MQSIPELALPKLACSPTKKHTMAIPNNKTHKRHPQHSLDIMEKIKPLKYYIWHQQLVRIPGTGTHPIHQHNAVRLGS